jgi:hypothetical protein
MEPNNDAPGAALQEQSPPSKLAWVASLPVWQNRVVLQQLGLVFAIPLMVLLVILALIQWPLDGEGLLFIGRIVLIAAAVYAVLLLIGMAVVSAGGYQVEYRMDHQGIAGAPHGRTAQKNAVVNALLVFSGRPAAGMLAQSRQVEYAAWKDVDRVETDPKRRTVTLYKSRMPLMVVACDDAHYDAVLHEAQAAVTRHRTRRHRTASQSRR